MELKFEPASFRDPDGHVAYGEGRVFRVMSPAYARFFQGLNESGRFKKLEESGLFIPSWFTSTKDAGLDPEQFGSQILEHERLQFLLYPYEWSFDMLKDAALITLETMELVMREGLILKDATPFNVAFHKGRMVFFDWFSLEEFKPGEPWAGYRQFCREFLYPLMLTAYRGVEFQAWFRGTMRGIEPRDVSRVLTKRDWFRKGVFSHVVLHSMFERSFRDSNTPLRQSYRESGFSSELILRNVARLKNIVQSMKYDGSRSSEWVGYGQSLPYTEDEKKEKSLFLKSVLGERTLGCVVDLGCNAGLYSRPFTSHAKLVIGIDADAPCINRLYRELRAEGVKNYVPVVNDFLNPSPDQGWGLQERKSLYRRIEGELFLALALVHHVTISGNVPLKGFVEQLAQLAREGVVEWVDRKDPMVQKLLTNRKEGFEEYRWDVFEKELKGKFQILKVGELNGGVRRLCHVVRR